jgi:hypothetical protein
MAKQIFDYKEDKEYLLDIMKKVLNNDKNNEILQLDYINILNEIIEEKIKQKNYSDCKKLIEEAKQYNYSEDKMSLIYRVNALIFLKKEIIMNPYIM